MKVCSLHFKNIRMKIPSGMSYLSKKIIACLFLFSGMANAALPISVIEALKQSGIPQSSVGIYVQAVDEPQPIISHHPELSMNPASVMKLVTTNAALDLLTPAYHWKTEIYRDGPVSNGVLNGNLIIKGYGDPSFKAQDFWRLLMAVQQAGIRQINGDLIIDKSIFAENIIRPAFDNEVWRAYNAEPSAFLVDGRHTSFKFSVAESAVHISQEFELNEIEVVNRLQLSQADCGDWRSRFAYSVQSKQNANLNGVVVTFNGSFSPECGERYLELSVLNDEQYAFYTFKKLWGELGGTFTGKLKVRVDNKSQEIKTSEIKVIEQMSEPLGYVIRDMNKWSNNLTARQLLLTLAAEKQGVPATESVGASVIKNWLAAKNIDAKKLVIENGSGLSRIERISSEHLGWMLVSAYNSPAMPEFIASLPILGLDGTAQRRMKESAAQNRVHMKTGSLEGVSSVAGYIFDSKNKRYAFVMMVNHPNAAASRTAQDALIEWIYSR